ncbi:MAG TPA: hypothetical protein VK095_13075 [Beutenbergiaceae bacterium]|nr:hypothetical protein [Beutenbergiaceae bacterium]
MTDRIIVASLAVAGGIAFVVYACWARAGRSPRARRWAGNMLAQPYWWSDRFAVLAAPAAGIWLISFSLMVTLPGAPTALVAILRAAFILASLGLVWGILSLPIPRALYPRWARAIRDQRKQVDEHLRRGGSIRDFLH